MTARTAMTSYFAHFRNRTLRLAGLAVLAGALAGCQGISGIQPISQVRVIDTSPDAPAIDIHQNSATGLYNVGFGTVSSYIPLAPGAYTHAAYTAGTQQKLATVRGSFQNGGQYTVLTGNIAASLQMTVLRDQSTPAPAGQVSLRFLNQTTRAGDLDLYLMPAGGSVSALLPVASRAAFGANTGYINAPSGTYSLLAFAAGALPATASPAYTGTEISYPSGSARTLILIDHLSAPVPQQSARQAPAAPSLQMIAAADFDPSA